MRYREDDFQVWGWLKLEIDRTIWNEEEAKIEQLSLTSIPSHF